MRKRVDLNGGWYKSSATQRSSGKFCETEGHTCHVVWPIGHLLNVSMVQRGAAFLSSNYQFDQQKP